VYHVVGYTANTFGVNNFDMAPIPDDIIAISNGHYLPHIPLQLYGGWLSGTLLSAIRLVTPRSRQIVPPPLYPIQQATLPPDRPHIFDRRNNSFLLNAVEEVSMQCNLGGAANALTYAIMFWGQSLDPVPTGDIYALHGTSVTAATANAWSTVTVTWDQTIPAGTYTIIGSQHVSTNAIAHRWIFKNQILRPGFISMTSLGNIADPSMYYGGWGSFGSFNTYTYPSVQVLCNGADASHDITMFMIKTG
jgi:hypothetical protein